MLKVVIFVQRSITWFYRPWIALLRLYFEKVFRTYQGKCPQESFNVKFMEICSLKKWLHYPRNSSKDIVAFKDSLQKPPFTIDIFQYLIEVQNVVINGFIWSIFISLVDYIFLFGSNICLFCLFHHFWGYFDKSPGGRNHFFKLSFFKTLFYGS